MKLVNRENNVIDGQVDLDTMDDFPVFMGCVEHGDKQGL